MPPLTLLPRILGVFLLAQSSHPPPKPVEGWHTSGPALYQINAVATEPTNELPVYAAASIYQVSQSALFRSADGGRSWVALVEAAPGEFYSEILVDPRQPQRIYAGSLGNAGTTNIYRSIDGGAGWSLTQTLSPSCGLSLAPGSSPNTVLAACGTKVLRSEDGGASWSDLTTPFSTAARLTPGPAGSVLAYEASAIFRTTNDGATWVSIASAPPACPGILALRVDPEDGNVLVAGTGELGGGGFLCGGVFRSADAGKTWSDNTLPGLYVTDVTLDARKPSIVFASASFLVGILPRGGVFESADGGLTWTNLRLPASGAVRLALSPSGRLLHAATTVGVFDRGFRRTTTLAPR